MSSLCFLRSISIFIFLFSATVFANQGLIPSAPGVNAKSYIMLDFDSGHVLVEEESDKKLPPASLTKIMTVYVVASELAEGRIAMQDQVTVSKKAWRMPGSRMFIEVDKQVSVEDLLKGIVIQSGNDASVALAEYISGTEEVFAELMNQHAVRLGMLNTHFENSTGLPGEQHYTTARDLALLAKAYIRDFPDIYALNSIKEFTFNKISQKNRNKLLWRDPSVDGLKTGHTDEAGYCLVASAKRDNMRLITVVMGTEGAEARAKASQSLLNYGFRFYETHHLYKAKDAIASIKIWKGEVDLLNLGLANELILTIPRGQYQHLKADVETPETTIAPITKNDEYGTLILSVSGEELMRLPMISLESVNEAGLFKRLKDDVNLMIEKISK